MIPDTEKSPDQLGARKKWFLAAGLLCALSIVSIWVWKIQSQLSLGPVEETRRQTTPAAYELKVEPSPSPTEDPSRSSLGTDAASTAQPRPLLLVSTSRGRNAREGSARLGTHIENPQTYVAGATLGNGARLLEIYDDHVVLEREGKFQSLFIASSGKKTAGDLSIVGGPAPVSESTSAREVQSALTDFVRPSPEFSGEQMRGLRVYAGQRSSAFYQWGLQNGDLITSIEGQPLLDAVRATSVLRGVVSGMALEATVERSGKVLQVTLDGRSILAEEDARRQLASIPAPSGFPTL